MTVELFTIGFTETSAEHFFGLLRQAGVRRIIDIRLNNTSQLAGFSKRDDLRYFLRELAGIDYVHVPEMAPTPEIFEAYKKHKGAWPDFEKQFKALIARRRVENVLTRETAHRGCLLCSEKAPEHCHRRLIAEHLKRHWGDVTTRHLV
ncbi:MAG: DUF488 domain-containing protein [Phycisphaerae bacterium]|nr:DUF488 domain-containing protein [Phycisphaerae bacterium]NUQ45091.1 DUF488 domain-containing protein [Phycisphaerae bacterium]